MVYHHERFRERRHLRQGWSKHRYFLLRDRPATNVDVEKIVKNDGSALSLFKYIFLENFVNM